MPELPEVETFVRGLASAVGRTIASADVPDTRLAVTSEDLAGARIAAILRKGKYIKLNFEDGRKLVIHLRMSGRLRLDCDGDERQYVRLVLHLDDGESIYFVDPRRLGTADVCEDGFHVPLGVDPLDPGFTKEALAALLSRSRAPIKPFLLNQRKIGGMGNIYAAEALWRARIDPRRRANELTGVEVGRLHKAIVEVLTEAIARLGTTLGSSVSDYRPTSGEGGSFRLAVYGREGEPCSRCGEPIERVIQAGRSTCFCPKCQR
ncbi:MAG: bifunctional DNA-formamidopyrimidine glycosylase/DNA-(apurinic or apyrimidinic site) lyase [Candidatus Bipolaricaulis sp.]|nr:bifunctional DNA-formamidopyrimidine glycosylase/DNA-(apurinic or apyrimidinic site) lyase [Candidatus Bipolaricaulis sp.]MDD5646310.1 bifunctional DNA-formamidopyrimidine glycosylase/DNA-(apurinic or apyrimidinic site) lyase [Candidatus Bipolaricaulis sp.]